MARKLILIVLVMFSFPLLRAQTNISLSNPEAIQVINGNYNPGLYIPAGGLSNPDSVLTSLLAIVSKDTLTKWLLKIDSYHNRNTGSDTISSTHGIGAVRRWIYNKFEAFRAVSGNRLVLSYMDFDVAVCGQTHHRNILAVLPGLDTTDKEIMVIEGHFDTRCQGVCDTACYSPGMEDNGSGTVLVMELARLMSQFAFSHTIVFACVTGEDQGLYGGTALATYIYTHNIKIRACFNNDVIGGIICGATSSPPSCPGQNNIDSTHVRIFSYSLGNDSASVSPHKQLARYVRMHQEERLNPLLETPMKINIIILEDRVNRSGDHIPFRQNGYTTIRFTSQNEHGNGLGNPPDRQHSVRDVLGVDTNIPPDSIIDSFFVDMSYLRRNILMNGINLGFLASAPHRPAPEFTPVAGGLKITLHNDDSTWQHYRIGIRSKGSGSLYFDTLITFTGSNTYTLSGYNLLAQHYISVCSVDSINVESLFCNEYKYTTVGIPEISSSVWGLTLEQNRPNPFTAETVITVKAGETVHYPVAALVISDMTGRNLFKRTISISAGINEYTIPRPAQGKGFYLYSLEVAGKKLASRKMVVY